MISKAIYLVGLGCCLGAAILGVLYFTGKTSFGSVYTPFLLFGIGALLLIRARLTRS